MAKYIRRLMAVVLILSFCSGCSSGVSQDEYKILQAEKDELEDRLQALQAEYDQFKGEASEFLELQDNERAVKVAQANKARIEAEEAERKAQEEADRLAAEREAEEERARQAEEAQRLAEEAMGYETGITFEELSRSPDDYTGKKVKFSGQVLQVVEGIFGSDNALRMSTSGSYDDVIYVTYSSDLLDVRLLEDDKITIYGEAEGLKTYSAVMGNSITLPKISADRIELQ